MAKWILNQVQDNNGGKKERSLTDRERALAGSIFGDAIVYGQVRIHRRRWWLFQPREITMAPDGHIWFHPTSPHYRDCFASADLSLQAHFIHEMTHVWQAQRGGRWYLPLMRHPFCRYGYTLKPGKAFHRYGVEQQAEIVTHLFLQGKGCRLDWMASTEELKQICPFVDP